MSGDRVSVKPAETDQEMEAARGLRVRVFVEEQGVPPEEEFDEHDRSAIHAIALVDGRAVGTGRLYRLPSGETRIGRMAVEAACRRKGIGGQILSFLEDRARRDGASQIVLHAQTYVQSFYHGSGYVANGEPLVEVGIKHIRMVKDL